MRSVLTKIFHGALYGLGFGVIVGGIFYYLTNRLSSEAMSQFSTAPDAVEISSHRKLERDGKLLILGELKNKSEDDAKNLSGAPSLPASPATSKFPAVAVAKTTPLLSTILTKFLLPATEQGLCK